MSIITQTPWTRQPPFGVGQPSPQLGLTALLLPGQNSVDIVSKNTLSSVLGTPTRTVTSDGPALEINATSEAIYTAASAQQKTTSASIVWAGTLRASPTQGASLGGTTFDASNTNPYVGIELKRKTGGASTNVYLTFSYGVSAGNFDSVVSSDNYASGPVVIVGVFESGRQLLLVKSAIGIERVTGTRVGSLSYGATARIEIGDSLNARNASADCAVAALAGYAWPESLAYSVVNDVWGKLFFPQPRRIWVGATAAPSGFLPAWAHRRTHTIGAGVH